MDPHAAIGPACIKAKSHKPIESYFSTCSINRPSLIILLEGDRSTDEEDTRELSQDKSQDEIQSPSHDVMVDDNPVFSPVLSDTKQQANIQI